MFTIRIYHHLTPRSSFTSNKLLAIAQFSITFAVAVSEASLKPTGDCVLASDVFWRPIPFILPRSRPKKII